VATTHLCSKSPCNLNSLYSLGRFVPGEKRVSHAINKKIFFCASWTFIAIFLRIKIYLSARKNHLQSLCNLPLRGWDIWGTIFGNISGAWWEHDVNTLGAREKKNKKIPCPPLAPPPLKKKKKKGPFSLAAWNFSFQKCSSPIFCLGYTNANSSELGVLILLVLLISYGGVCPKWFKILFFGDSLWLNFLDWPITPQKKRPHTMDIWKRKDYVAFFPLVSSCICYKGRILGKGIQCGAYWELMGTCRLHWEHHWEPGGNTKIPPPQNHNSSHLQRYKKTGTWQHLVWYFLIPWGQRLNTTVVPWELRHMFVE